MGVRAWPANIPLPHDGETIFSIAARAHLLNFHVSAEETSRALLGSRNAHRYAVVPHGLEALATAMRGEITASEETLRRRSSLAPLMALLPAPRRALLVKACMGSDGSTAQARSGLNRFPLALHLLKFCRRCVGEQVARGHRSFWDAEHQWPGNWLCRKHGVLLSYFDTRSEVAKRWPLPEHCLEAANEIQAATEQQLIMLRVREAVEWLGHRHRTDTALLQTMLRWRLRVAGYFRSELKWLGVELDHAVLCGQRYLSQVEAPDIKALNQVEWLRVILADHRVYYPLPWAIALGMTGKTSRESLNSDYEDAMLRRPQPDLFDRLSRFARHEVAPAQLYAAFEQSDRKIDVVRKSGLSEYEVNSWLRRDAHLGQFWRSQAKERRQQASVLLIRDYLRSHPSAKRVDLIKDTNAAYRWLELNAPDTLRRLIPPPVPHLAQQIQLEFSDRTTS